MTLLTDDMDLAGDIIQSLATYMSIEVCGYPQNVPYKFCRDNYIDGTLLC